MNERKLIILSFLKIIILENGLENNFFKK